MFRIKFLSILIIILLFISCSSDDDGGSSAPQISSGQLFSYLENQSDNSALGVVQASDEDEIISFSIASGNTDNYFSINNSGAISLTNAGLSSPANDFENMPNEFVIGVNAENASGNLSDTVDVTLEVADEEQDEANYFPLVVNNSWDYTNTTTDDNGTDMSNETMTLASEEMVNDTLFFQAETDNISPNLTTTGILVGGQLFKKEGQLQIKGQFDNFGPDLPGGFSLPIESNIIPLYSTTAGENAELFAESDSFTQSQDDIDFNVNFTLSSQNAGSMDSMDVSGTTYDNVIASSVTLTLEITATPNDFPITIPVLEQQDVLTATHFFADGIGMIKSEIITSINFEDLSDLEIDLPNINSNTVQELQSNNVTLP